MRGPRGFPPLAAAAALILVGAGPLAAPARATPSGRTFTIYAVSTHRQYANHADDRKRGTLDNPFNVDTPALKGNGEGVAGR